MEGTRTNFEFVVKDTKQKLLASMIIELALHVPPTPFEVRYIWLRRETGLISGLHIRRLYTELTHRRNGYASHLVNEAIAYSRQVLIPLYIDVRAERMDLRKWLRSFGFAESIFWYNSGERPMVRYRFY
ncbi:MAG: GNAT family N-acetyltransferase [Candidatus Nitrotoga sp.]